MLKRRIIAVIILVLGILLGYAIFYTNTKVGRPFHLGLDLSGGTALLYKADITTLPPDQVDDSMEALRDVIERRVNAFGVGEPVVQVQKSTITGITEHRLAVELPGITDIKEAVEMIGQTPLLEFFVQSDEPREATVEDGKVSVDTEPVFVPTELTGKYLKRAQLTFNPTTSEPEVTIQFNDEGSKVFEKLTGENVGKIIAIFLDKQIISAPVVNEAISGGTAQISGAFTPEEAKQLVGRLNSGALPVPISLISTQSVGATLGADAVQSGVQAATIGFILIALFLILWYRLPGLIAALALSLYVLITLALYKLIPVTLSAAGLAGFIISIGIAVDANILIFERFREERARGKSTKEAIESGFDRAWLSIRDANISGLLIAVILFWFGTSLIKGFALTLGLGILVSMISAIMITRIFLRALPTMEGTRAGRLLFSSGLRIK